MTTLKTTTSILDELDNIYLRAQGLHLAICGAFEGNKDLDGRALSQLSHDMANQLDELREQAKALLASSERSEVETEGN